MNVLQGIFPSNSVHRVRKQVIVGIIAKPGKVDLSGIPDPGWPKTHQEIIKPVRRREGGQATVRKGFDGMAPKPWDEQRFTGMPSRESVPGGGDRRIVRQHQELTVLHLRAIGENVWQPFGITKKGPPSPRQR